jgi:hypothetical protein
MEPFVHCHALSILSRSLAGHKSDKENAFYVNVPLKQI